MSGRLQHVTSEYRKQLQAQEDRAVHQLELAYSHVQASIQPEINRLLKQINDMQRTGQKIPVSWLYEQKRLSNIQHFISTQMGHYGKITQAEVEQLQHYGANLGEQSAQEMLGDTSIFNRPSARAIESILGATQDGSPLASLFDSFGSDAASGAKSALVRGITLGYGPAKVARDLRDALGVSRTRALTIARTEMLRAYNGAALENYRANSSLVNGWVWIADMSDRTCAACIAMNGTEHTLDEDMDSHVRCRCSMGPITNTYSSILGSDVGDTSDTGVQDGSEWFSQQSAATQRTILGNSAYEAYNAGAITLRDMVGKSHSSSWGTSVRVKSLKEVLGAKQAQKYYKKAS